MRILLLVLTLCTGQFVYSQGFDDVEIITHQVTDKIYMLEGRGGNVGVLIGDEGVIMIDDQFAPLSEKLKTAIAELSDHPVKYLLNTHWHGDHTGGNANFGSEGAIIVAHNNVRERLSTDQFNKAFNRTTEASPEEAWPQITFTEDVQLHLNDETVMLIHVHNAHTDGDSFVWFADSNVLHMGDTFFKDRFPYIDLGSGGTTAGYLKAAQTALMLTDSKTKIIPGHGPLANKMDLLRFYTMLNEMHTRVQEQIDMGKSIEEIKAAGLDKGYEDWGSGFINGERIVDIIWTDLTREEKE